MKQFEYIIVNKSVLVFFNEQHQSAVLKALDIVTKYLSDEREKEILESLELIGISETEAVLYSLDHDKSKNI